MIPISERARVLSEKNDGDLHRAVQELSRKVRLG